MLDDPTKWAWSRRFEGGAPERSAAPIELQRASFHRRTGTLSACRHHKFHPWLLIALLLFLGTLLLPLAVSAQRIALVVGNAAYTDRPLRNPVNDARLMQTTLRELGFEVQVAIDVDRRGLLGALRDFEARARGAEVALFYFAGHGAQVGGANYLIPLNAPIRNETDVPDEAVDASSVLRRIEDGRARVGLVILDACRDNPYPGSNRSTARGLARMSVPTGTIVAYATAPGSTAEDGAGNNGTYTAALARYLAAPGLDIKDIFDRTAQEVERVTNGKQRPREEIGLRGRFVLREGVANVADAPAMALPTAAVVPPASDPEVEAWELAKRRDNAAAFEGYLRAYPGGRFAEAARVALDGLRVQAGVPRPGQASTGLAHRPASGMAVTQALQPGHTFKDCAECPQMVVLPAGGFLMGSPQTEEKRSDDEGPQSWVSVSKFAIGKYEVTQREWISIMGNNPSFFNSCGLACPVENVSWGAIKDFLVRLSRKTSKKYRLPSEVEWEYAARAGSKTSYSWGDDFKSDRANSGIKTTEVGSYKPNSWGLYDLHGNVWEWVEDIWYSSYRFDNRSNSTSLPGENALRVYRGGSWGGDHHSLRSANRGKSAERTANAFIGFRVALDMP